MKSVVSDVFNSTIKSESNKRVEAFFSYDGIIRRVSNSPILMGTTNRLLKEVNKQVVDIYFNKK